MHPGHDHQSASGILNIRAIFEHRRSALFAETTAVNRPSGRDRPRTATWERKPVVVAAILVLSPLALTLASYGIALAMDGPISAHPLRTIGAALSRLVIPGTRADSWDPMLHALALALQGGSGVYETIFFQLHEKFQYPLTSLLWLDALGAILRPTPESLNRLNAILFACNAAACVALFRLSFVRPAMTGKDGIDWKVAVIAFAAAYVFWPTLYALYIGQIQVWIDLLFTLALTAWILERPLASGLLIGLACTIKPQLGLFLLWGIAWREWRFAIGVGAATLSAAVAAVWRYGLMNNIHYLDVLSFISQRGESFHANQSVNGLMNRLLFLGNNLDWVGDSFVGYSPLVYVTTALFSAIFVALPLGMAIAGRRRAAGPIDLALGGLCFTMASPIAWEHHYGVTLAIYIVAFGLLCRTASTKRLQVLLCLLGLSWLLVGSNLQALDVLSQTGWNVLQSPVLFGALLLVAILTAMIGLEQRPVTGASGVGLHKSP